MNETILDQANAHKVALDQIRVVGELFSCLDAAGYDPEDRQQLHQVLAAYLHQQAGRPLPGQEAGDQAPRAAPPDEALLERLDTATLIARSSLGTPSARLCRSLTSTSQIAEILRRRDLLTAPGQQSPAGLSQAEVPFGPEISWPEGFRDLDPESREVLESAYDTGPDSFEKFWAEDEDEDDYAGLFPREDPYSGPRRGRAARAKGNDRPRGRSNSGPRRGRAARGKGNGRRIGRRRGRSNDHRLWLALAGVVIAAAAVIFGILKFEFPPHSGPAHVIVAPATIGSHVRTVDVERQTNVAQLRDEVIKMSSGQAGRVVSAVYESGGSAAGSTEQIIMFIGGHLANAAPATSIASFTQRFADATVVSAGSLGGKAACVEEAPGTSDSVAMCVWFDNDSFGGIVSPTMNATSLANVMRTMRPSLELVVRK
jgi:hypothetical protein